MTSSRELRSPEALAVLGQQLRHAREAAGLTQGRVKHMRQATISKIENGLDVTLDSFLTYVASLGLEVALVPYGSAAPLQPATRTARGLATAQATRPLDLLDELDYLKDPE